MGVLVGRFAAWHRRGTDVVLEFKLPFASRKAAKMLTSELPASKLNQRPSQMLR